MHHYPPPRQQQYSGDLAVASRWMYQQQTFVDTILKNTDESLKTSVTIFIFVSVF